MKTQKILVTGASIAGPTLAYWLARQGMDVTVVERAPAFRDGGQTIDVRGAGRTVVQRMGLEAQVRAHNCSPAPAGRRRACWLHWTMRPTFTWKPWAR